jgi:Spy/CpxP family protein refolding chaperone
MRKTALLVLLTAGMCLGQPGPAAGGGPPPNLDAIRIWKLTEALKLTEEQTVTFLPLVQIHERKLREAQREIQGITAEGRNLLKQENISQKDVDKLIKRYTAKQTEIFRIKQDFVKTLPQYLTPEQQLLYIGFEARFRKELREFMKERHGGRDQNRLRRP